MTSLDLGTKKTLIERARKRYVLYTGHERENERQEGLQSHLSCEATTTTTKEYSALEEQKKTIICCRINS